MDFNTGQSALSTFFPTQTHFLLSLTHLSSCFNSSVDGHNTLLVLSFPQLPCRLSHSLYIIVVSLTVCLTSAQVYNYKILIRCSKYVCIAVFRLVKNEDGDLFITSSFITNPSPLCHPVAEEPRHFV